MANPTSLGFTSSSATELNLQQLIAMQKQVSDLAVRRKHIRSAMSGSHVSRLRGRGMEFDEVRIYQPGDDVGSIDWKVTARKGTTHVKMYHEERERPVLVCLDYRKSMFFATQGSLKSVVATQAAALLAWHGVQHGDRLGGLLFSEQGHFEVKPTRGRKGVLRFLHACCQDSGWQKPQPHDAETLALESMTSRLRQVSKPGTLIYILSDFRGLNERATADLVQLARHNDVVLISIFDVIEREFPSRGDYPVFDGTSYFSVSANSVLGKQLKQKQEYQIEMLTQLQRQHGIFHMEMDTQKDVGLTIREGLWSL